MNQRNFTPELSFKTSRSGGKGGQHVNKVSSKVELLFHVDSSNLLTIKEKAMIKRKLHHRMSVSGHLHITSEKTRSQHRNKQEAIDLFYMLLSQSLVKEKKRIATAIPKAVQEKRLKKKRTNAELKQSRKKLRASDYDA